MDQQPTNSNKLLNVLIVLLGLALLGLGIFFVFRLLGSKPSAYISAPFAQNINYPYKIDDNQLYFYTGHGFATMDIHTGLTKQLGQARVLPNTPTSVQWTKDGAFVQASSYTIFDELGAMVPATSLGQDGKATYLWYVPFTGTPVVVDKNVSTFYVDSNTGMAYYHWKINPAADGALLKTYSATDGARQTFQTGSDGSFRIVYGAGDALWALTGYGETINLVKYNLTGPSQDLAKNIFGSKNATVEGPLVMISDKYYVASLNSDKKSVLVAYDLVSKKSHTIDKDFTGSINRGSAQAIFANSSQGKKIETVRITSPEQHTSLTAELNEGSISSTHDAGNNWLSVDLLNRAHIMSTDQAATQGWPEIKSGGLDKVVKSNDQYDLSIDLSNAATSNSYAINVYPAYPQNVDSLLKAIQAAGYDPNQLELHLNYTVKRQ